MNTPPVAFSQEYYGVICGAVGGLFVALINGIFSHLANRSARKADERRQIRELAVKVALDNWKMGIDAVKERGPMSFADMNWINVYLVHASHMVAALDGSMKTKEQVEKHLNDGFAKIDAANDQWSRHQKEQRKPKKQNL